MYLLLLLVSLATAGPAGPTDPPPPPPLGFADTLPPPPTAKEVEGWDVVRYNDYIVGNQMAVFHELMRRVLEAGQLSGDPTSVNAYIGRLSEVARIGRRHALDTPPFQGDARFRDAIVANYDYALVILERELPSLFELTRKENPRNADLAAAEQIQARIDAIGVRSARELTEAHEAFAEAHRVLLRPSTEEEQLPSVPEFSAPGLPPAGSRLSASAHVAFAMGHHNALIASEVRVVRAMNAVLEASGGDAATLDRLRGEALATVRAEVRALRATEDWQGDGRLRAATLALAEGVEELLAKDLATYCDLARKERLTQEEADRINGIARDINPRYQALITGFVTEQAGFAERWSFAAWAAWKQSLAAAAAAAAQDPPPATP